SGRPVLTLDHGARRARTVAPDNYIREINQAAVEGRTAVVWLDAEGNVVSPGTKGAQKQYVITDVAQERPALPKKPIFSEDPAVIELARERMSIRTVTAGKALDDIIEMGTKEGWAIIVEGEEEARSLLSQGWRNVTSPRF